MKYLESYESLQKEDSEIPQVIYLTGYSEFLKTQYLELLLRRLGIKRDSVTFMDSSSPVLSFLSEVSQPSFFAPIQVFVLREVDRIRSGKAHGHFISFLEKEDSLPKGHYVVLMTSPARRNPKGEMFDYFKEKVSWVECDDLREHKGEVSKWVRICMKRRRRNFSKEVVRELAELCKGDLYGLESEIEKLSYYPGSLTVDNVREIVLGSRSTSLQGLYDMISLRNGGKALEKMTEAMETLSARQVLNGLSKFLHQLLVTSSVDPGPDSTNEIAESLGVNPYYVKKLRAAAIRFSPFHLTVALNRLAKIDVSVREARDTQPMMQSLIYFLCESPDKMVVRASESELAN